MPEAALDRCRRPVESSDTPQCSAKLFPKPVERREKLVVPFFALLFNDETSPSYDKTAEIAAFALLPNPPLPSPQMAPTGPGGSFSRWRCKSSDLKSQRSSCFARLVNPPPSKRTALLIRAL